MTTTPQRFTKRPVTIEAAQLSETRPTAVIDWIRSNGGSAWIDETGSLSIRTLEGVMYANEGDWIIRGVQGEFYPCKPDIFTETYQPAAEHHGEPNADGPTDAEVAAGTRALMDALDAEGAETARPEDWTTAVRAALVAAREMTRYE